MGGIEGTKHPMKLSIIIVNWNVRTLLEGCLTSIYSYPPPGDFDVFVLDNASTDDSPQMVKERFPQVNLIENKENAGFACANNQGIERSTGRYVLLLNPDTEVKPNALESLVRFMDDHPSVGAAGSRLNFSDGNLQHSCHPEPTIARELWHLFHLDRLHPYAIYPMESWDLESPKRVDVLQGASLILRRTIIDQVGTLDEDFFMYSEEVDLCFRIRKAGWELYWVPQSHVIHFSGQSTGQVSREMFLHLYKGKLLYYRKHYGWWSAWIYKSILYAAGIIRLLITPFTLFERSEARQRHLTLAGKYYRMLLALPRM